MPELDPVVRFHEFEFSGRQMELRKRGHRVRISASQLRLLTLFLGRPGELVTRDEVIERLWTDTATIDTISGVNTAINRLRFHLGDDANAPRFLETVIGVGYRFIAPIEEVQPPQPVEVTEEMVALPEPSSVVAEPEVLADPAMPAVQRTATPDRSRVLQLVAAVMLVTLAAGWFWWKRSLHPSEEAARPIAHFSPVTSNYGGRQVVAEALSRDGKQVAYADDSGIRVKDLSTHEEFTLATLPSFAATGISWFPGDKQIAVSGTDCNTHRPAVWMLAIQGVGASVLAADADLAAVAPDGKLIAVARSDRREIDLIHQDGVIVRKLIETDAQHVFSFLSWSPDSRRLIAISHDASPVESPDLEHSLYESIQVSDSTVLAREADTGILSAVALPDGRLDYVGASSAGGTITRGSVFSVVTDPGTGRLLGTPQEISHLDGNLADLSASSDGSKLAVLARNFTPDVFTAALQRNAAGSPVALQKIQRVTSSSSDAYPHAWGMDNSIVYESNSRGQLAVMAERPNEIAPRVLGQFPYNAVMAQITPDDRYILFLRLRSAGQNMESIYRMPIEGGEARKVPGTDGVDEFRCTVTGPVPCVMRMKGNDAQRLYFALDPVSGVGRLLAKSLWQPSRRGDWGVSPDGSMVAVANHDAKDLSVNFLPLNGGSGFSKSLVIRGHGSPLGVSWDVDGRSLFVETRDSSNFDLLSVTLDGHIQLLRKSRSVIWAVSSPDGKSIAFPDPTLNSNVWLGNLAP